MLIFNLVLSSRWVLKENIFIFSLIVQISRNYLCMNHIFFRYHRSRHFLWISRKLYTTLTLSLVIVYLCRFPLKGRSHKKEALYRVLVHDVIKCIACCFDNLTKTSKISSYYEIMTELLLVFNYLWHENMYEMCHICHANGSITCLYRTP